MKIVADLHTHTIACGHAFSTIQENVLEAKGKNLDLIAITDHGPKIPGGPHPYYFKNLTVIPQYVYGIRVLRGIEANIMNIDGEVDLQPQLLERLDIVLAGFHKRVFPEGLSIEDNTKALINTMKNPYVNCIVHPGNPLYPLDIEKVVQASIEYDVYLEINNSSLTQTREGSLHNCKRFADEFVRTGASFMLGSDAHISFDVGEFSEALKMLDEAGANPEQVLNTSLDSIYTALLRKKEKRRRLV